MKYNTTGDTMGIRALLVEDFRTEEVRFDHLIEQWVEWMATYRPGRGLPGASAFARLAGANLTMATVTERFEESVIPWEISTVDTCIDDLPLEHRLAINAHHLGMTPAVFHYRRAICRVPYPEARAELTRRLKMKGCL